MRRLHPRRGPLGAGAVGRNACARRLAALLRIARTRRWLPPPRVLARELDVHPRTVKRDLEALEEERLILPLEGQRGVFTLIEELR